MPKTAQKIGFTTLFVILVVLGGTGEKWVLADDSAPRCSTPVTDVEPLTATSHRLHIQSNGDSTQIHSKCCSDIQDCTASSCDLCPLSYTVTNAVQDLDVLKEMALDNHFSLNIILVFFTPPDPPPQDFT